MTAINPVPGGTVKLQFGRSQQACTNNFFFLIKTLWSQINFLCSIFTVSPALRGREERKRGGHDWGLRICSRSACSSAAIGSCLGHGHTPNGDEHTSSSYPPLITASNDGTHTNSLCLPGQNPRVASQDLAMAAEGVSVRAGDALGLSVMQDRGSDGDKHCCNTVEHTGLSHLSQSPSNSGKTTSLGRLTYLFQWRQKKGWK